MRGIPAMGNYYRDRALGKLSGDTAIVKISAPIAEDEQGSLHGQILQGLSAARERGLTGVAQDVQRELRSVTDNLGITEAETAPWYRRAFNASVDYFNKDEDGDTSTTKETAFDRHMKYLGELGTSAYNQTGTALQKYYDLLTADTTEENKTNQMLARVGTGIGLLGLGTGLYGAFSKSPEEKAEEQIQSHLTPQEQELRALGYGPPFVPNVTPDMLEKKADDFTSIDLNDYKARNRYRKFLDSENALSGVAGSLVGGVTGAMGVARVMDPNASYVVNPILAGGLLGATTLGGVDYGLSKYDNWDQKKTFGISDYDKLDELLAEEARLENMLKTSSEKTAFIDGTPMPIGPIDIATPFLRVNLRDPASRARYAEALERDKLVSAVSLGLLGTAGGAAVGATGVAPGLNGVSGGIIGALVGGGLGAGAGYGMQSYMNSRERDLHAMDETQQRDQEALRQEQQEIAEEEIAAKQRIERLREALKKKL